MTATDEFTVAVRSSFDRHATAARWVESLYPENAWLINDQRVDLVVRGVLRDGSEPYAGGRDPENANILVAATGAVVLLTPDTDVDAAVRAAAGAASRAVARCDYCGALAVPTAGLLPVVAPPQIVVLALCTGCVAHLDAAFPDCNFLFPTPTPETVEG